MKCKEPGCWFGFTFAHEKHQWGRLKRREYSEDEIKQAMPRCQKHLTRWMKDNPPNRTLEPVDLSS